MPEPNRLTLPGLAAPVSLYRDRYGIPHIKAGGFQDAFFAQGFAHAQDRLWQMDSDRMKAQGRWAERVGPIGVEQDKLFRRFRLAASARRDYDNVQPETKLMLDAYAAGVNAYITSADQLPVEYGRLGRRPEPWQPWDGLAVYKVRHVLMGVWEGKAFRQKLAKFGGPELVAKLYPLSQPGEPLILPTGGALQEADGDALADLQAVLASLSDLHREDGGGSNNWVVSGERSGSGKPLLAGDPHRAVDVPNVYYQNHVACDQFDVIGLSFPGLPGFPHFGHNDRVAWCITHTGADTQDLFVERFDSTRPDHYLHKGEWKPAEVTLETISVRDASPEQITVVQTIHGCIIAGDPASGSAIAMQYTATQPENTGWDCLLPMLRARSVAEFDGSMAGWVDPVNNLLTADIDGNIGFRIRGKLPIRPARNGWLPVPGWTGEHDWQSMVPFNELPSTFNPPEGFLATANNRVVGPEYPHYLGLFWAAEHRARRIIDQIHATEKHTADSFTAIHADVLSRPAQALIQLLGQITPTGERAKVAKEILSHWDGQMKADQVAPSIYSVMREELLSQVLRPLLGDLQGEVFDRAGRGGPTLVALNRARVFHEAAAGSTRLLPPGATWEGCLTAALESAVAKLTESLGPDMAAWTWGKLHQLRPLHQVFPDLSPPPSPMGGDGDTVQAAGYTSATGFTVAGTAVARYLFDLADWDQSGWVVPHGASGEAASRHVLDQHETWLAHRLVPMLYAWEAVAAAAESYELLVPSRM